jgi:hypothetical protein
MIRIALAPKRRASRIYAHRDRHNQWLMQWNYTQRVNDAHGVALLSSFRSIVTRPGLPGLWLDSPYYCYAGTHRYRRLPQGVAARVILCCARGWLSRQWRDAMGRARTTWVKTLRVLSDASPTAILRRRRERRAWLALIGE